jgi:arginase
MTSNASRRPLTVVGAPSSAGSYAAGQEAAPRVLREYDLVRRLRAGGREVTDSGDGPLQVWHPDREHPLAQNFVEAAEAVRVAARMVGSALDEGRDVLLLGGNCTVALGAMSALVARDAQSALLYVDRHFDLNTPKTTTDGALDWMGVAGALGLLPDAPDFGFPRTPLLAPDQLGYVGVDPAAATDWEREQVERLGIRWSSNTALADDPYAEIAAALEWVGARRFALHLDVDVLDFIDAPLAENTDCRNHGPSLDAIAAMLSVACAADGFRILSIGELNPTRAAGTPDAIPRFVEALASALA